MNSAYETVPAASVALWNWFWYGSRRTPEHIANPPSSQSSTRASTPTSELARSRESSPRRSRESSREHAREPLAEDSERWESSTESSRASSRSATPEIANAPSLAGEAPPPPYERFTAGRQNVAPPNITSAQLRPPSTPTNFRNEILKNENINGVYTIDPNLRGDSPSPPSQNLHLQTVNGNIQVELHLTGNPTRKRVELTLKTTNGNIQAKLGDLNLERDAFMLEAQSTNGIVTVLIPRNFRGVINIGTTNGEMEVSRTLLARLKVEAQTKTMMRCILEGQSESEGLLGDEITVFSVNGEANVKFVDEM